MLVGFNPSEMCWFRSCHRVSLPVALHGPCEFL